MIKFTLRKAFCAFLCLAAQTKGMVITMSQVLFTDKETVENFIKTYKTQKIITETTLRATLSSIIQNESHLNKFFYQFTKLEILNIYKELHSISVRSLQNRNLILNNFAYYVIKSKHLSINNIYEEINKGDLLKCVDQRKKENCLITREQLTDIQNNLLNYTDKGILEALFLGFGGNKLKELTFFDLRQMRKNDKTAIFETGKVIPITDKQYDMIVKAYRETSLISFGKTYRSIDVISLGFFKKRSNNRTSSSNPQNDEDLNRRYRFIQRRPRLISKEFDLPIKSGRIQDSGLLYNLQKEIIKSGEPFDNFIKTEAARSLAQRYDIYTEFYSQILKEKFGEYFDS